jgi:predicted DNA-binding protein
MAMAGRGDEQYMVRLPGNFRSRINAHSEKVGTSMNSEIARVIERKFP